MTMRPILAAAVLGLGLTAAASPPASAIETGLGPAQVTAPRTTDVRWRGNRAPRYVYRDRNVGGAFAAGVAGALIGGALAAPYGYQPYPYAYGYDPYGYDPSASYEGAPLYVAPAAGAEWCARRHPNYDPTTGLYTKNKRFYRCP